MSYVERLVRRHNAVGGDFLRRHQNQTTVQISLLLIPFDFNGKHLVCFYKIDYTIITYWSLPLLKVSSMKVEKVKKENYSELINIWEASVRATHDFLQEKDINYLKPLILEHYFDAVDLKCVKNSDGKILGFSGVADGKIEMLFISPESRGKGVGAALCQHEINNANVTKVDVNEQNPQAIGFYEHIGFKVIGRSPLDGQGKPFPLLHMALGKTE